MTKRAVIVGASSGVGRALAEELARNGFHLVLASREERDLAAVAADLQLRQGIRAYVEPLDLDDTGLEVREFCDRCVARLGGLDAVLLTAGKIDPRDIGPGEEAVTASLIRVNYSAIVQLTGRFCKFLEIQGAGTIVIFSSISAGAPRRRNTVYSSTKAALETYCQGLRHYFSGTGVVVQTYALGYVDSTMTFGQKLLFPISNPQRIALAIIKNMKKDRGKVYLPRFWGLIVLTLRLIPWSLYKRLSF